MNCLLRADPELLFELVDLIDHQRAALDVGRDHEPGQVVVHELGDARGDRRGGQHQRPGFHADVVGKIERVLARVGPDDGGHTQIGDEVRADAAAGPSRRARPHDSPRCTTPSPGAAGGCCCPGWWRVEAARALMCSAASVRRAGAGGSWRACAPTVVKSVPMTMASSSRKSPSTSLQSGLNSSTQRASGFRQIGGHDRASAVARVGQRASVHGRRRCTFGALGVGRALADVASSGVASTTGPMGTSGPASGCRSDRKVVQAEDRIATRENGRGDEAREQEGI